MTPPFSMAKTSNSCVKTTSTLFVSFLQHDGQINLNRGQNGQEGKGPGTSPSGWADAGSNPGSSNEGEKRSEHRKAPCT